MSRGKKSVVFETVESGDTGDRKPFWFLLQALSARQPSVQPPARGPGVVNGALIRVFGGKARGDVTFPLLGQAIGLPACARFHLYRMLTAFDRPVFRIATAHVSFSQCANVSLT
jgi:hypothetical protein